jgi:hypothetical protein
VTVIFALDRPAQEKTPQQLADQIKQLSARVAILEKRVAELEKRQPMVVVPQPQPSLPHAPSPSAPIRPLPKGWQQREFNGIPYYIVPLDTPMKNGR